MTHGIENGLARFPEEMETLERLGLENFDALAADLDTHGIACDFEPTGELDVCTDDYQLEWLAEGPELLARYGYECETFDAAAIRAEVASPTYVGGLWVKTGAAVLDPGKLAFGLREAALRLGVRVYEHSGRA